MRVCAFVCVCARVRALPRCGGCEAGTAGHPFSRPEAGEQLVGVAWSLGP